MDLHIKQTSKISKQKLSYFIERTELSAQWAYIFKEIIIFPETYLSQLQEVEKLAIKGNLERNMLFLQNCLKCSGRNDET